MRLTKLELQGFKSFADATTLAFDPGATAIVGPNGCGKSNVADAVRWVLGEQRARTLRGGKMDDVIFQGSSARRPVNVAEVSLHFDNDDGTLPVAYREVVVTRRLSRSGESDYLLNGAPCRLRDIHDLMRGTGLGANSAMIIESRMVDALLSDRPDDRRELFEEAAGIGLYRDRRRTTERRLEETAVDVARLDDLIGEVHGQVRSLSRQRRRAERHAELTSRFRAVDVTLADRELAAAHVELDALSAALTALDERMPAAESAAQDAESRRTRAHADRTTAETQRAERARLVATQQEVAANLRGEIAVGEERQRNARSRRQQADSERHDGEAAGGRIDAERTVAAEERARLDAELQETLAALSGAATREDEARRALAAARARLDAGDAELRLLRDGAARADLDRAAAAREQEEITQRLTALAGERTAQRARVATATGATERHATELAAAQTAAAAATAVLAEARDAKSAAVAADATAGTELARAEAAVAALDGKLGTLEALERERVGLAPAAARLLQERTRFDAGAVLGPLSDYLSAGADDATVIERFLGSLVHAVLVRDHAAADAIRAWHAEATPGPLLLLPADAAAPPSASREGSLAARVAPADAARNWVEALLGRVRDLGSGTAFEDAHGAIWLPGAMSGVGPLRRRADLASVRSARDAAQDALERATERAAAARVAADAADRRIMAVAEVAAAADQAARTAEDRHADAERQRARAERDAREMDDTIGRLAARAETLLIQLDELRDATERATRAAAERETLAAAARVRVAGAEQDQDAAREAHAARQVARAQYEARLHVATERERRLTEEWGAATGRLAALRSELDTLSSADRTLLEHIATWRADLTARQAALAATEAQLAAAETAVRSADEALSEAEGALDAAHRDGSALGEERHRVQLRHAELAGRDRAVRDRVQTEWRGSWEALVAACPALTADDATLRAEAAALREEIAALGPVNPLAIEEHAEELKRSEFLAAQRADLAAAQASLHQAIREIDATARELFLTTFHEVRDHFRQIFMTLFGGGECDLRLENSDAPLDCDIEIHASPRGKRTQRIHLLSTGERALVALSLLFGIFLAKPSPFCLLDEVDAPLDDQNIGQFVHMVNTFKAKTQFIVITHNPRTTTDAADAVYGVTMQEPGVSSFVSVRLRAADPPAPRPRREHSGEREPASVLQGA